MLPHASRGMIRLRHDGRTKLTNQFSQHIRQCYVQGTTTTSPVLHFESKVAISPSPIAAGDWDRLRSREKGWLRPFASPRLFSGYLQATNRFPLKHLARPCASCGLVHRGVLSVGLSTRATKNCAFGQTGRSRPPA
jgi:hypothetical protein